MSQSEDPESPAPYEQLPVGATWVAHLRTRLPYSFGRIKEQREGSRRSYVLDDPNPKYHMDPFFHNLWLRGGASYLAGLTLDRHGTRNIWQLETLLATNSLPESEQYPGRWTSIASSRTLHNMLQMDRLLSLATWQVIDRERVLMTNIMLGLEYCLKALQTHANHRDQGVFRFESGHDIPALFEALPDDLQEEIAHASTRFAGRYLSYRAEMEAKLKIDGQSSRADGGSVDWQDIQKFISAHPYTMFLDGTDPGVASGYQDEQWLHKDISACESIDYFRYSRNMAHDPLPVPRISAGLRIGRFLYEHLFPIPGLVER